MKKAKSLKCTVLRYVILLSLFAVMIVTLTACVKPQEAKEYAVVYAVTDGGYIEGDCRQSVEEGKDAETVTAKALTGYLFTGWSDGAKAAERTDTSVKKDITVTAAFKKITLTIEYVASEGGALEGDTKQTVPYGEDAETVTAVPDEGYRFVKWSDTESVNPIRADKEITKNIFAVAEFEKICRTYTYIYNNATDNSSEASVELRYETLFDAEFVVPVREYFIFDGWYLEKDFKTRAVDEQGNLLLGYEIFDHKSECLFAKFTVIEELTYKILMVFVTESQAVLTETNGNEVIVDYKMSKIERQILEMFPDMVERCLNALVDGLVKFEIDTYYTTVPIGSESFSRSKTSTHEFSYNVFADKIPEVSGMLDDYRSIITTYGTNDYDRLLHTGFSGSKKYASIAVEGLFSALISNNVPLETLLNFTDPNVIFWWKESIDTYVHEFTHTVESHGFYEYHDALRYYRNGVISFRTTMEATKLYLLNQLVIEGEKVGIAYGYWKDDVKYTLRYNAAEGGSISGSAEQDIHYTQDSGPITAVPDEGYEFIKWSDGYEQPERWDHWETAVTAEFGELTRRYFYYINHGDDGLYIILRYFSLQETKFMVPEPEKEGYRFGGWYIYGLKYQLTDEEGNAVMEARELFQLPEYVYLLHPKWIPEDKTFIYDYRNATGSDEEQSVTITDTNFPGIVLAVPVRNFHTFGGWYLDADCITRVTDWQGKITIGYEIFESNSSTLYAKWTLDTSVFLFTPIDDETCSVRLMDKTVVSVSVPELVFLNGKENRVTEISMNGFALAENLVSVYLPVTVKKIGAAAFMKCLKLKIISMAAVEIIGANAFSLCPALKDLLIPETVHTVGATILRKNSTKVHVRAAAPGLGWNEKWNDSNEIKDVEYNSDFEWPAKEEDTMNISSAPKIIKKETI